MLPLQPTDTTPFGVLANLAGLLTAVGLGALVLVQRLPPPPPAPVAGFAAPDLAPCVMDRDGYWRGRISGAGTLDLDWRGTALACAGDARPGGRGLRLYFAGHPAAAPERLLLILGIAAGIDDLAGHEYPVSVTLIDEASNLFFHDPGGRCFAQVNTVVPLSDQPRSWRIDGELYCAGALAAVGGAPSVSIGDTAWSGRLTLADE